MQHCTVPSASGWDGAMLHLTLLCMYGIIDSGGAIMPNRKLPPNEEVVKMYRSGMSSGEIAEKCGVKPVTVLSLLARIGEPRRSTQEASNIKYQRGRGNAPSYWQDKKQPPEMVERRVSKIRGSAHYMWKGGKHRRPYRDVVEKHECENCQSTENLGIHHRNFDHYDNREENLQVLCVSCHMSLHKQAYWDAVHAGKKPVKGNGPIGWERSDGGADANPS